jgi:dolichyl-phosphate beta-glucosyltransferase
VESGDEREYNHWMDLSIVIPAYDEGKKIAAEIEAAGRFLNANKFSGEIIVVDDGSDDNTTDAAKGAVDSVGAGVNLKVLHYDEHRGKGYAVRAGIRETKGEFVMFCDCGGCVPYENAMKGLEFIKRGQCDIAHGSRKLAESKIVRRQSFYRRICSRAFSRFAGFTMGVRGELTDTQCGFKIYRGDAARKLYGECETDGFMFDIEIIMRAEKAGLRIKEFPIEWRCDLDSRLKPGKNMMKIIGELAAIRKRVRDGL